MGDIFGDFRRLVLAALNDLAAARRAAGRFDHARVAVEPPRDPSHGDLSTNAAMVLAGQDQAEPDGVGRNDRRRAPRPELGQRRLPRLRVYGGGCPAGFINIRLDPEIWHAQLRAVLAAGTAYGASAIGDGQRVNIEFVSANPTGPMHVGHGRGAVFGDALAALLEKAGYAVHREYYINDAGAQVDMLARSLHLRYRQALGETVDALPEGLYPGEYLIDTSRELASHHRRHLLDKPEEACLPRHR